ncbi:hypothetical protein F5Y18DRAFT_421787 [Xylariaceae sp. FL1019]|nr:hypothetical protein F5Y18DRAFT_421787 [Xylariaceae sp. FL1019]
MESASKPILDSTVVRTQSQENYDEQSSQALISGPMEVNYEAFHDEQLPESPIKDSMEVGTQATRDLRDTSTPASLPSPFELRAQIRRYVSLYRTFASLPKHRSKCHPVVKRIREILETHPDATLFNYALEESQRQVRTFGQWLYEMLAVVGLHYQATLEDSHSRGRAPSFRIPLDYLTPLTCECLQERLRVIPPIKKPSHCRDEIHASEVLLFCLAPKSYECRHPDRHTRSARPGWREQGVLSGSDEGLSDDTYDEGCSKRLPVRDLDIRKSQGSKKIPGEWAPCGWPSMEKMAR